MGRRTRGGPRCEQPFVSVPLLRKEGASGAGGHEFAHRMVGLGGGVGDAGGRHGANPMAGAGKRTHIGP